LVSLGIMTTRRASVGWEDGWAAGGLDGMGEGRGGPVTSDE